MNSELMVIQTDKNNKARQEIALALGKPPEHKDVSKFIAGAMMDIEDKVALKSCSTQSIIKCLIQCATLGLAVDNRKLAYLVPFGGQCTLMPGYLGYISKIKEADATAFVTVGIVHKGDKFACQKKSGHAEYTHVPANPFADGSADIEGAYCHIRTVNGSSLELMSKKELDKVRGASKMKSGAVWSTWELEMIKKSVVRRACKLQFTEAVSQLNAIDDRLFEMSNRPQIATIAQSAPMPEPLEPAIAHEIAHEQAQTPERTETAPISQHGEEQAMPDNDAPPTESEPEQPKVTPNANELAFSGEVEAYSPAKDRKPAAIKICGEWYSSRNEEVIAIMEGLRGQTVDGTYTIEKNGKYENKVIATLGD